MIFEPEEAALLTGLPDELRGLVDGGAGPVHDRLFPRAYLDPTEEDAESEWQRLMHAELLAGKLAALDVVVATLAGAAPDRRGRPRCRVSADEAEAWLGVLNDARLALGVMLDVTEDLDPTELDPSDERLPGLSVYGWLTWFQGTLIEALES
jgi:hypothetical protein